MNEEGVGTFFDCNELSVAAGKGAYSRSLFLHFKGVSDEPNLHEIFGAAANTSVREQETSVT